MTGLSTLCYIGRGGKYLMLHRTVKKNDVNKDKWIGVGGHFEADESPEECILREVWEETGYRLTSWAYRGLVTFVSGNGVTEYMSLFTADDFEGTPHDCDEGVLEWVDIDKIGQLNLWAGDRIFFRLLEEGIPFFSLKLVYNGSDRLVSACLNGRPMELFDVLDKEGQPTGVVQERGVVHRDGLWHETVHMWIVRRDPSGRPELLLQKRSQNKDSHPGCYDISSAGHIPAGEDVMSSALRELGEELGINASERDLTLIGRHAHSFDKPFYGRMFRDREWSNVFIYQKPVDISSLTLQASEVESVRWMDLDVCRSRILDGSLPSCIARSELDMLEKYLADHAADHA